jgi:hypothetical protein
MIHPASTVVRPKPVITFGTFRFTTASCRSGPALGPTSAAEGRSNAAIAHALVIGEGAVEKHVANIFAKLDLPVSETDNRRVLAVLRYLES